MHRANANFDTTTVPSAPPVDPNNIMQMLERQIWHAQLDNAMELRGHTVLRLEEVLEGYLAATNLLRNREATLLHIFFKKTFEDLEIINALRALDTDLRLAFAENEEPQPGADRVQLFQAGDDAARRFASIGLPIEGLLQEPHPPPQ